MRIGIISDTHDQVEITRLAVAWLRSQNADLLVHCGDISTPPVVRACEGIPALFVFGNHDADNVPSLDQAICELGATCLPSGGIVTFDDIRIAIVHGHVGMRPLLAQKPDYLLHGHSHAPADYTIGSTRCICPGALFRAPERTIALLETASGHLLLHALTNAPREPAPAECRFCGDILAPHGLAGIGPWLKQCELPLTTYFSAFNNKVILRAWRDDLFDLDMDSSTTDEMFLSGTITDTPERAEKMLRSLSRCLAAAGFPHRFLMDGPDGNLYATIEHLWNT
jgi:putative phosphoesterase